MRGMKICYFVEGIKISSVMSTLVPTILDMPCFSGYFVLLKIVHTASLSCDKAFLNL